MSDLTIERLYPLLPAIYRQRDLVQGEQLHALMSAIENQFQLLQADMEALYDNWFIETADDWVVPYIADQVGIDDLTDARSLVISQQRRRVANTIGYRRRKGAIATLEHVAQDVTGWAVHAAEYSQLMAMTQHLANVRRRGRLVDVRGVAALDVLHGPFDKIAHTVDVREIGVRSDQEQQFASLPGKYRPDHIGLFVWRLQSYPVANSPAKAIHRDPISGHELLPGCFTFHPLGRVTQLFNQPQELAAITDRTAQINVPDPISRAALADDLTQCEARYHKLRLELRPPNSMFYGPDRSVFVIQNGTPIPPSQVTSADLSRWLRPQLIGEHEHKQIAVDPILGRLMLLDHERSHAKDTIEVHYSYGFSADLGGGPYSRSGSIVRPQPDDFQHDVIKGRDYLFSLGPEFAAELDNRNVSENLREQFRKHNKALTPHAKVKVEQAGNTWTLVDSNRYSILDEHQTLNVYGTDASTFHQALAAWESYYDQTRKDNPPSQNPPQISGIIQFLDNGTYGGSNLVIKLHKNSRLVIQAADGVCPNIVTIGALVIDSDDASASLILEGLWIDGKLEIKGSLDLTISHCTLMPYGISTTADHGDLTAVDVAIDTSIVGPIHLPDDISSLDISNSIIDHATGYAIAAPKTTDPFGPAVTLAQVTVLGKVRVKQIQSATNVIFTAPVVVQDSQSGLVSFSYVPEGSLTPRLERCQPALALEQQLSQSEHEKPYPLFTSTHFGDPGYAQLSDNCAREIRRGAADGSEMGAFHDLYQALRHDNLSNVLDEYIPFGLSAGIFFVT